MVAAELARLQEREKFLEREVRTAQRAAPNAAVALDEEVVTRMLGEEAARILHTAREAATQIKVRAEEGAGRLLREATDEAQRVRQEAEIESARRRHDASSDAEAELQMAKQQGRDMVNEARAYRERVLGELARRRELARQQIEQLVHGRDRLVQAFERARLAAVDVMSEMTPLGEPSEYVNLAPTTGPVPLMLPVTRPEPAAEPEPVVEEVEPEPEVVADEAVADTEADTDVVVMRDEHELHDEPDDDRPTAPVVALFAGEFDRINADATADDTGDDNDKTSVDDLFARLRAARNDVVAERAQHPSESAVDEAPEREFAIVSDDLAVFQASPSAP